MKTTVTRSVTKTTGHGFRVDVTEDGKQAIMACMTAYVNGVEVDAVLPSQIVFTDGESTIRVRYGLARILFIGSILQVG